MKTRERIVSSALELFNEQGERNITTNHIAAYIEISPGNLYYHFRNKQEIVRDIFDCYSKELLERFAPVETHEESLVLLRRYLDSIFTLMWKYRFFYANLPEILQRDEILHDRYLAVQDKLQTNLNRIFSSFIDLKLLNVEQSEVKPLVTCLHLVASSWLGYQSAMSVKTDITESIIHQGVLQMISIVKPHTTAMGREQIQLLEDGIKAMNA
ncbi:TetR family transcriptional regulator [Vibrio sp. MACH09]|uniref:TetR/AcrR family transcriptional regulator n=1 Tax=unclassified Vibrio TaxID=2614977 RepID=UPI00149371D6|nr:MULTISPECIES: TetR/AcrR family transcriptional regulator [unclassified Vibrio]NOI68638.1 TetR/AcrR family transcriptional regulator [Vibrio sp. 99-8-1]GLO59667.1 TetR family transcriptional regulator [Vibrio sp. MACH09]